MGTLCSLMNAQGSCNCFVTSVMCFLRLTVELTEMPRKTSLSRTVGSRRKLLSSAGSLVSLSFPRVCIAYVCVCGRLKGVPGRILTRVRDSSRQRRHTGRRRAGGRCILGSEARSETKVDCGNGFCSAALCARD